MVAPIVLFHAYFSVRENKSVIVKYLDWVCKMTWSKAECLYKVFRSATGQKWVLI